MGRDLALDFVLVGREEGTRVEGTLGAFDGGGGVLPEDV